jgi:hypothetical protein
LPFESAPSRVVRSIIETAIFKPTALAFVLDRPFREFGGAFRPPQLDQLEERVAAGEMWPWKKESEGFGFETLRSAHFHHIFH